MTDQELIKQIVDLYVKARETTFLRKNLRRGRNHSVSSKVEDLFAIYIAEIISSNEDLPDHIKLLIDQPFTYTIDNKTYSIYPDIAIIKDMQVKSMFDVKMDLGWNRDFYPFCKEKQDLVDEIRGRKVKAKDGTTKEEFNYTFSETIKYNIVIISNENISKKKREGNDIQISNLDKSKIEFFALTENAHPNSYDEKTASNIEQIQHRKDFARLKEEIRKNGS